MLGLNLFVDIRHPFLEGRNQHNVEELPDLFAVVLGVQQQFVGGGEHQRALHQNQVGVRLRDIAGQVVVGVLVERIEHPLPTGLKARAAAAVEQQQQFAVLEQGAQHVVGRKEAVVGDPPVDFLQPVPHSAFEQNVENRFGRGVVGVDVGPRGLEVLGDIGHLDVLEAAFDKQLRGDFQNLFTADFRTQAATGFRHISKCNT